MGKRGPKPSCLCGTCTKCKRRQWSHDRYQRDPERHRKKSRQWVKAHPEERRTTQKVANAARDHVAAGQKRRLTEPDFVLKDRARNAVENAIRRGRLSRQPCEECGAPAQAHHEDYTKPLEVQWLCPPHHSARHVTT